MSEIKITKKNVLVTGGAGFIGSHLCDRLLQDGHRVICIDNLLTSHVRNIDSLLQNSDFQFLRLDLNEPFDLEKITELAAFKLPFQGIQEIYHLACPTSIKNFDQFRIQTLLSNSLGNYHALELAKKYRAKILLTSSSVVYGERNGEDLFFAEDQNGIVDHLSPRACYDEGKRFSETMFETYHQVHGLETKIARIFRTYGPRMPLFDGHLVPDFIMNALDNKEITVYGDEDFRTSLAFVTDIVDGLVRLMDHKNDLGPVNLGSDTDMKVSKVVDMVLSLTNSTSTIKREKSLPFLSELGLPRIVRAKELGWIPLVRLEDGLRRTIDYMRANKILLNTL
ncbi:NAD-dependent epimerase/dehydratase family protein [Patescibacteria group bacterium]